MSKNRDGFQGALRALGSFFPHERTQQKKIGCMHPESTDAAILISISNLWEITFSHYNPASLLYFVTSKSKIPTAFTLLLNKYRESRFGLTHSTQFCDNSYRNIEIDIKLYGGAENKGVDNNNRKTYNTQQGNIKWIGEGILLKGKYMRKQGEGFFSFMISKVSIHSPWLYSFRAERSRVTDRRPGQDPTPQEHHLALQLLHPSSFHFPKFPQPLK